MLWRAGSVQPPERQLAEGGASSFSPLAGLLRLLTMALLLWLCLLQAGLWAYLPWLCDYASAYYRRGCARASSRQRPSWAGGPQPSQP